MGIFSVPQKHFSVIGQLLQGIGSYGRLPRVQNKNKRCYYLLGGEEEPKRIAQNKRFIPKTMLLPVQGNNI